MRVRDSICRAAAAVLTATIGNTALAQCEGWSLGNLAEIPGVLGTPLDAIAWDPDGPGPQEELLIVAGYFSRAGTSPVSNIASWDGESWSPLGAGLNGPVLALAVYHGQLIAGGEFSMAGEQPANRIAAWNGVSWREFQGGVAPTVSNGRCSVRSLTTDGAALIVAGEFARVGNTASQNIARWDGSAWQSYPPPGFVVNQVRAGTAGLFCGEGGETPRARILRAENGTWQVISDGWPRAMAWWLGEGGLPITSKYEYMGSGNYSYQVAQWDGSWNTYPFAEPPPVIVTDMLKMADRNYLVHFDPSYSYYTGGITRISPGRHFYVSDSPVIRVTPWRDIPVAVGSFTRLGQSGVAGVGGIDGSAIRPLGGNSIGEVALIAAHENQLVVGRYIEDSVGTPRIGVVDIRDGETWIPTILPPDAMAYSLTWHADAWYMGGWFYGQWCVQEYFDGNWTQTAINHGGFYGASTDYGLCMAGPTGSSDAWRVSLSNGEQNVDITRGLDGYVSGIASLHGQPVLAGTFTRSADGPLRQVITWNGTAWTSLGSNPPQRAYSLVSRGDELFAIASSPQRVFRWDGSTWSNITMNLGTPGRFRLAVWNDRLFAAGQITVSGISQGLAEWNPTAWQAIDGAQGLTINSVAAGRPGLYIGGSFSSFRGEFANNLARYGDVPPWCPGDFDCSGAADGQDVEAFFRPWEAGDPRADLDLNGALDNGDVEVFFESWEQGC